MLIYISFLVLAFMQLVNSSFHMLIILLTIELMVLALLFSCAHFFYSLFMSYMILLIGVCVSAFGVCLFISINQSSGVSYMSSVFPY